MQDQNTYLTPNRDEVVSKVIDGEAIVINLSNGIYYSMDKVAALVWDLIDRQVSVQTIVDEIASRYNVAPALAAADVEKLVAQLVEEQLISETSGGGPADLPDGKTDMPDGITEYEAPFLNIYRDMGDLLALDPPQPGLENTPWRAAGDDRADEARE